MNMLRLIAIALPVMLLMACGGGGGGGGAAVTPTTPTPMTMMPPPGDGNMNPLVDLANFMPTTSSSLQAIQDITNITDASINISNLFEAGGLSPDIVANCGQGVCVVALPSAINTVAFVKSNLTDISLINENAFFSSSSYSSEITNGVTIEDIEGITFARGKLTGTRAADSNPLEFESFAGWLDGSIFGIMQITIGASGSEQ